MSTKKPKKKSARANELEAARSFKAFQEQLADRDAKLTALATHVSGLDQEIRFREEQLRLAQDDLKVAYVRIEGLNYALSLAQLAAAETNRDLRKLKSASARGHYAIEDAIKGTVETDFKAAARRDRLALAS